MKFSLVIPCYNEANNLHLLLERCASLTRHANIEVVLVDNGSTDNTPEVLQALLPGYPNCRTIRVDVNQGYGFGILSGLRAAKGEILGWTHADMQTDPLDCLHGLNLFEEYGKDIFVKGKRHGRPISDVFFTTGMSVFETLLLGRYMWDINAQPTMFMRTFFELWDSPPHDFSLDLFAYFKAKEQGLAIKKFPVLFGNRAYGTSHWNVDLKSKWKFIKRTMLFSLDLRRRVNHF